MPLCFIEPIDVVRVVYDCVGRDAREQIVEDAIECWVDQLPEEQLTACYAQAVADLETDDIAMLAAWHASLEIGSPVPSRDFLVGTFPNLGKHRREALRLAATFRGEASAVADLGADALTSILKTLDSDRVAQLAGTAMWLYVEDRIGSMS